MRPVQGVLPVLHLTYRADGAIDESDLEREIDWVFRAGADGCCLAMASDLFRVTPEERIRLGRMVVEMTRGRGAVVVSVGAESTKQAVLNATEAERAGADGVMAIPPSAVTSLESEVETYFGALAEAVSLPVVIQDASSYVGRPLPLAMQVRLFDRFGPERILFKPESNPIGPLVSRIHELTKGRAKIFEGSGGLFLVETFRRGLQGAMPGSGLIDGVVALWKALRAGDDERVYRLSFPIIAITTLQNAAGLDGFITLERHILRRRGVFKSTGVRGPLAYTPDPPMLAEIDRLVAQLDRALAA